MCKMTSHKSTDNYTDFYMLTNQSSCFNKLTMELYFPWIFVIINLSKNKLRKYDSWHISRHIDSSSEFAFKQRCKKVL